MFIVRQSCRSTSPAHAGRWQRGKTAHLSSGDPVHAPGSIVVLQVSRGKGGQDWKYLRKMVPSHVAEALSVGRAAEASHTWGAPWYCATQARQLRLLYGNQIPIL
jgi:hypothetical protein